MVPFGFMIDWRRASWDEVLDRIAERMRAVGPPAVATWTGHGVAAKGVTGSGYEGHYFWDTEIYVSPFLIHTNPRWARNILEFRCAMLDAARERARELGHLADP